MEKLQFIFLVLDGARGTLFSLKLICNEQLLKLSKKSIFISYLTILLTRYCFLLNYVVPVIAKLFLIRLFLIIRDCV